MQKCYHIFDVILGSTNNKNIEQFFTTGWHIIQKIYYLSQSNFDLPKRTIRNNSNKIILSNQTLKDFENIYRDVGGYDMSYNEFEHFCRKSWEEERNYLCIDRSKKRDQLSDERPNNFRSKSTKY